MFTIILHSYLIFSNTQEVTIISPQTTIEEVQDIVESWLQQFGWRDKMAGQKDLYYINIYFFYISLDNINDLM